MMAAQRRANIVTESSSPRGRRNPAISNQSSQTQPRKGQFKPLAPSLHNAFLSLKIANLGDYVAQRGLPVASTKAQSIYGVVERHQKLQKEVEQDTKQKIQLHQQEQEQKKRAHQLRRELRNDRTSFLTLKVNKHALRKIVSAHEGRALTRSECAVPEIRQVTKSDPVDSILISDSATLSTASSYLLQGTEVSTLPSSICANQVYQQNYLLTPPDSSGSPQLFLVDSNENLSDQWSSQSPNTMSDPSAQDVGGIDDKIKDVIQNLYEFQQHIHAFRPEQQNGMLTKVDHIAGSLKELHAASQDETNPIQHIRVAPDIIDYVDAGRNPDIYTREFVELVQRGNSVMKGKQKAFRDFSRIFAKALKDNFDGMDDEVDTIMRHAGIEERDGKFVVTQQNGHST